MVAPLKALWDRTSTLWSNGSLIGKVGQVFTSASSVHGGQETTAISMMFPMLHHGMIIVGLPYSVSELFESGSPYGPSRIVGPLSNRRIDDRIYQSSKSIRTKSHRNSTETFKIEKIFCNNIFSEGLLTFYYICCY